MGKRILVCDDAPFMRMMIKEMLDENGYDVVGEADTGNSACRMYNALRPQLVLLDITLPDMDGIEVLKRIREQNPAADVIMCSAMGQQELIIKSIQAGARDFIIKPFRTEKLVEAIKKVIG